MSERLVPSNASPLEVALDETLGSRIGATPMPIAESSRPLDAPSAFVPFLAFGRGVDLWNPEWSDERKRKLADRAIDLQARAGTLSGIRDLVDFADGRVLSAVTPPAEFFAGGDEQDDDERWAAFLKSLPEIRIFQNTSADIENGYAPFDGEDDALTPGAFLGAENGDETFFADGPPADFERAVMIRNGHEEPVTIRKRADPRVGKRGEVYDLHWRQQAEACALFDDPSSADGFLDGLPKIQTHVSVALGYGFAGGENWHLVAPMDRVQDIRPELGMLPAEDLVALYLDDGYANVGFADAEDPQRHIYRSIRILERAADWSPAASFADFDRLGMPAYTAELVVEIPSTAAREDAYADACFAEACFADRPFDPTTLNFVCDAVVAAKSLRDDILLDLNVVTRRSLSSARTFADLQL
ncbi:phage tail protein I [Methylopila sp. 73B]|uniref:phage tail protein I n=1 Tax=Methylopila sp. 73B TaxID=1120792 RepID=UPI0003A723A7|nr:phage tail protein I [Methylopila sp. 73B]